MKLYITSRIENNTCFRDRVYEITYHGKHLAIVTDDFPVMYPAKSILDLVAQIFRSDFDYMQEKQQCPE